MLPKQKQNVTAENEEPETNDNCSSVTSDIESDPPCDCDLEDETTEESDFLCDENDNSDEEQASSSITNDDDAPTTAEFLPDNRGLYLEVHQIQAKWAALYPFAYFSAK